MTGGTQQQVDDRRLVPAELAGGEPLLRRLVQSDVSPLVAGVVFAAAFIALHALVIWRAGYLRTSGDVTGFADDPSTYTNLVSGTLVVAYYLWMPRGIAALFGGLQTNRVIGPPLEEASSVPTYAAFLDRVRESFGRRRWAVGVLLLAVISMLVLVLPQYLDLHNEGGTAWAIDAPSLALSFVWTLINVYGVLLVFVYSALTIYWLRRLFGTFAIDVRPLHPDGAGGLAPLGTFTLMLSYVISLVGIVLVVTPLTRHYASEGGFEFRWTAELVAGLAAYVVAAPVVFFAPLAVAHTAMRDAKDALLLQIARRFEAEYDAVQRGLGDDLGGLEDGLQRLKSLQTLHHTTAEFPVWPLNIGSLARFGTSFVSPLVLAVLADVVSGLVE